MVTDIIFRQLFEPVSSTYTYLVADKLTGEAALIDPVLEMIERDLKLIDELELKLTFVLDTHIHADHVTSTGSLKLRTGARIGVSQVANLKCADLSLVDGQEIFLGDKTLRVISTPGHTNTCVTYAFQNMIFTGDTLLIRGCGRTDFQEGSPEKLFESVRKKLFALPDETLVYPGHDYKGLTSSSIGEEKRFNPRLREGNTLEDFKNIMSELKLAPPKKIHEALPANMKCGLLEA